MALCIPEAIGVPGLNGQPPTWPGIDALNGHDAWTASHSVSTPLGLDDPRWQGHLSIGYPAIEPTPTSCCGGSASTSTGFGSATEEDVVFRVLYDAVGADRFVYLSWWVKADDVNSILDDAIHVGFARAAGDAIVLRITPATSPATVSAAPVGPVSIFTASAGGGPVGPWNENSGAVPSWIAQNTHAWLDSVSHRWAVQMRVPIGAGAVDTHLDLADTFRMWFEVSVELPGDLLAPYSWPRDACVGDFCGFPSVLNVPDPAQWGEFHLRSGPADPACDTTGFVKLSTYNVGTTNSPTSKMNLISDNEFEAKPENLTGSTVNPGEINAEFRIADWGSIADPNAPWTPIPATGGSTNPASNAGTIADGTLGSITMRWQLSASEAAMFQPTGTKPKHQCILVTLSGAHVFNPASVWRNMDFVSASRFERVATLSNVGLGRSPVPGTPRPAYILVEKLNMPPVPRDAPDRDEGFDPKRDLDRRRTAAVGRDDPKGMRAAAAKVLGDPKIRFEQQPTIRYHVFHDTGLDVTREGRTLRVVRPGTAFGFHVDHEGDLDGWRDEIQGATPLSHRFYRIEIPEESTVKINTVVEAVESGGGTRCAACVERLRRLVQRVVATGRALIGRLRALAPGS